MEQTSSGSARMAQAPSTERYIHTTQADGRLLVRFIARRSDRSLAAEAATVPTDPAALGVLFAPVEEVARDPAQIAALVACVDGLSLRATPANVRSIRLTSTYLGIAMEDGEPPPGIRIEAWWIRSYTWLVTALAVLLLLTGIGLLVHMDAGRRLLQQLKDLRQQEGEVQKDIATLALAESVPLGVLERVVPGANGGKPQVTAVWMRPEMVEPVAKAFGTKPEDAAKGLEAAPLCERPLRLAPGGDGRVEVTFVPSIAEAEWTSSTLTWWREPATKKAAEICRRHGDMRVRLGLLYAALADWNCRSHQMFAVLAAPYEAVQSVLGVAREDAGPACGKPTGDLPPEVGMDAWRSHETRVTIASSVVAGFLLPLVLGCLGGCAYALRRIDQKLSGWTLEPQDGRHALVRVALAAVLGGLLGVVWTGGEPVALGGFSLSLAAAAFFIGFAVEPVFKLIETKVIDALIARLGKPTPAVPASPPQGG